MTGAEFLGVCIKNVKQADPAGRSSAGVWLSRDVTTLESCKFLRPEAGPYRLWPTKLFLEEVALAGDIHGSHEELSAGRACTLDDSDLCMAEWYRSSFGPNLTELAGSLTLALRVKAASELSLRGLIRKEVVRGWSAAGRC